MPNKLFLKHKKALIKAHGNKALDNFQIDAICHPIFGARWRGCNPQDKIVWKTGYQIINTDTSRGGGIHWVSIYITPKKIHVYDSFGRSTKRLLKILTSQATSKNINIIESKRDAEQFGSTEVCGHLSISWLLCVKRLGIKISLKI